MEPKLRFMFVEKKNGTKSKIKTTHTCSAPTIALYGPKLLNPPMGEAFNQPAVVAAAAAAAAEDLEEGDEVKILFPLRILVVKIDLLLPN